MCAKSMSSYACRKGIYKKEWNSCNTFPFPPLKIRSYCPINTFTGITGTIGIPYLPVISVIFDPRQKWIQKRNCQPSACLPRVSHYPYYFSPPAHPFLSALCSPPYPLHVPPTTSPITPPFFLLCSPLYTPNFHSPFSIDMIIDCFSSGPMSFSLLTIDNNWFTALLISSNPLLAHLKWKWSSFLPHCWLVVFAVTFIICHSPLFSTLPWQYWSLGTFPFLLTVRTSIPKDNLGFFFSSSQLYAANFSVSLHLHDPFHVSFSIYYESIGAFLIWFHVPYYI